MKHDQKMLAAMREKNLLKVLSLAEKRTITLPTCNFNECCGGSVLWTNPEDREDSRQMELKFVSKMEDHPYGEEESLYAITEKDGTYSEVWLKDLSITG